MPTSLTPAEFATAFKSRFAAAVKTAAGSDDRLSRSEAKKLARPFRDNAVNFLDKTCQQTVAVDKLIGRAHDYALATASKAATGQSAIDVRALPTDLRADARLILSDSAHARAHELRGLAPHISMRIFGEDDSGMSVKFVRRTAKVDTLDGDTFLKAFGFSKAKQEASIDQYSFGDMKKSDWDNLVEDNENKEAMQRVRDIMEPLGAKLVYLEDDRPFGAPVFVVAKGPEGELFGFRCDAGGMGF